VLKYTGRKIEQENIMTHVENITGLSEEKRTSCRPLPFWSWNDELEPEVLRKQVCRMHSAGLGGFFMHARGGLKTPYLSPRYLECVSAALDEASRCGMSGWLYDENGWPSGFGNGVVNGLGEKFQQKSLHCDKVAGDEAEPGKTIAWYSSEGIFLGREKPEKPADELIRCYYTVNSCYVDNLDREVTAEFIRCTHEYYLKNLPPELLPYLKGIFTDEPQLPREGFPWSAVLEKEYFDRYHRELLPDLPGLFMTLPDSRAIRVRFWNMITALFCESYIRQISRWCREHGWLLTGHHLAEEEPLDQIPANGSLMAQYSGYDIPGTDHLCRIKPDPVVMIQLVSAALQSGKKQILTESFGLAGWNLNFHGMYWLYHQQMTCGINLLCQHLSSYSLRGLRKRDYPGSYFIHQPWWEDYRVVNEHFAFAGAMLTYGKAETDVAVIHPLSSGWCSYTGQVRNFTAEHCNHALRELTTVLQQDFQEFHFIDEVVFAESGRADGQYLKVGQCSYSTVIIPPLNNLSGKLVNALMEFAAAGGKILRLHSPWEAEALTIDGIPAEKDVCRFFAGLPLLGSAGELIPVLDRLYPARIRVAENGSASSAFTGICRRLDPEILGRSGKFYLIANGDYRQQHRVTVSLPASGAGVEIISPDGCRFSPISEAVRTDDFWQIPYTFADGEAVMFFVPDEILSDAEKISVADPFELPVVKHLSGKFRLAEKRENLLLLDRCRYRVDGGEWINAEVNVIHSRLLKEGRECHLEMEFDFNVSPDFDLSLPLSVIVETPEKYTFTLNGEGFAAVDQGELFDQAFRRIPLSGQIRHGLNTLALAMDFFETPETYEILKRAELFETEYNRLTFDSEIENIFICGEFTVQHCGEVEKLERSSHWYKGEFFLAPLPDSMEIDGENITADGFPFFAGKITLTQEFELSAGEVEKIRFLRFDPAGANSFRVRINDQDAGFLYAGKYALPTGDLLKPGKNLLALELTTSLRNMLGPHHLKEGESYKVTTLSFSKEANAVGWKGPEFVEHYCMIDVGLSDPELA